MALLDTAIAFAATAHADQRRKYTGEPYVVHPIHVMTMSLEFFPKREDMAIAAVLHDVLEDCPIDAKTIERRFGAGVGRMVVALTKIEVPGNRAARKAAERDRLAAEAADVQSIKCLDIASNTMSVIKHDPGFAKVYVPECLALLEAMTKADRRPWRRAFEPLLGCP